MFRACERFGIRPDIWPGLPLQLQAQLLAYEEIRQHEELEILKAKLHVDPIA